MASKPSSARFIIVPRINVNDDSAKLSWLVQSGDQVKRDQVIGQLETTKALYDLHAESDGYFYSNRASQSMVKVEEMIALISDCVISPDQINSLLNEQSQDAKSGAGRRWTLKAELLAKSHGIAIDSVPAESGTIKEADVLRLIESKSAALPTSKLAASGSTIPRTSSATVIRLIMLGGGMAAMQIIDLLIRLPQYKLIGILDDDPAKQGGAILGVPIIDKVSNARKLWEEKRFDQAICLMPNNREVRIKTFQSLRDAGVEFANLIDPSVTVESEVSIGQGNVFFPNGRIGAHSVIGNNNFVSAGVSLDHHNKLGSHCTFGPTVVTSGVVTIGDNVKFGTGIYIEPHVVVGSNSIIASGVVLTASVPTESIAKLRSAYTVSKLVVG